MNDSIYNLDRFVAQQDGSYKRALNEVKSGHKQTHWIWYIFPQIKGLGKSRMAELYGIKSLDEAKAYMRHPVLGPRIIEISQALLGVADETIEEIVGYPDNKKVRSSMTLFSEVSVNPVFSQVLDRYFSGQKDPLTLSMIETGI